MVTQIDDNYECGTYRIPDGFGGFYLVRAAFYAGRCFIDYVGVEDQRSKEDAEIYCRALEKANGY